jgi:hypothetical protein
MVTIFTHAASTMQIISDLCALGAVCTMSIVFVNIFHTPKD